MAIALLCLNDSATAQQAEGKAAAAAPATTPPTLSPAPGQVVPQVEIKAEQDYDPRRDDTASKTVIRQEDIVRYGDSNILDVLKRAPGVTVVGKSIRMRGLGSYTQVLVNGERPPPGFDAENLAPEQVERIEIIRAATAEFSTQAIAGTINIVLKKVVAKPQRDLKLSLYHTDDSSSKAASGTWADRDGNLSYYVSADLSLNTNRSTSTSTEQFSAPDGTILQARDSVDLTNTRVNVFSLSPRLNWKLPDDAQLNWAINLQVVHLDYFDDQAYTNRVGTSPSPDYVVQRGPSHSPSQNWSTDLNWVFKLAGGKLDTKISVAGALSENDERRVFSTAGLLSSARRDSDNSSRTITYGSTGKYTRSLFDGHALATGWSVSSQRTEEDRLRVEGVIGVAPAVISDHFQPRVLRLAGFAQDEWNVTKTWSMYLGARWEGIRIESAATGLATTQSRSHVLSPVAQTLYKFPDKSGRQLRLALTRTYKAPGLSQLSARRTYATLNTRFTPDYSGNADLRPELATGVDLTYEHYWAPGAMFSVGASSRRISGYIRSRLGQDGNGAWLIQPVNDGGASVRTLDTELKFPLKTLWKDAPAFDLRASVNRNWSQVESVPGPDNRLDQQVPLSANLGADYKGAQYVAGASFAFSAGTPVRISQQQSTYLQRRRELEGYVLYKLSGGVQLRLGVRNALHQDSLSDNRYQDANGSNLTWARIPRSPRWMTALEMKF